jgi:hypothetical protein
MGVYMGISTLLLLFRKLLAHCAGNYVEEFFHDEAIYMILLAGCSMILAAASAMLFVKDNSKLYQNV